MKTIEKMNIYGVEALSNSELASIAYNLNNEQAEQLIDYVSDISTISASELEQLDGIGAKTANKIIATNALVKRIETLKAWKTSTRINDGRQVADILINEIGNNDKEHFICIGLDTKLKIKFIHTVSIGSLDAAPVHPREVFKKAVKESAAAVIVAHNHPSGDSTPSDQDIQVTERLKQASDIIGIKLLDHVIVGRNSFTSLKSEGCL